MLIFGLIPFVIIFLIFWANRPKPKTKVGLEEEIAEKEYNKSYHRESYREYKDRIARELLKKERNEKVYGKPFYGFENILLELEYVLKYGFKFLPDSYPRKRVGKRFLRQGLFFHKNE